jgi:hypothetical protein
VVIDNKIFQIIRASLPANGMNGPIRDWRELDAGGIDPVAIPELRSEGKALREGSKRRCRGSDFGG